MQQKIATQSKALETAMKLEASPVGEYAAEMNQIQVQFSNLMQQLQDIKKAKEYCDDIWFTHFHTSKHTKDTCPTFWNYLLSRAPSLLSGVGAPWCHIFQVYRHSHKNCDDI